jgi:hypothetical protein
LSDYESYVIDEAMAVMELFMRGRKVGKAGQADGQAGTLWAEEDDGEYCLRPGSRWRYRAVRRCKRRANGGLAPAGILGAGAWVGGGGHARFFWHAPRSSIGVLY